MYASLIIERIEFLKYVYIFVFIKLRAIILKLLGLRSHTKNVNNEKFKAVFLIKTISPFGINNITSEPNKGKNINNSNILFYKKGAKNGT